MSWVEQIVLNYHWSASMELVLYVGLTSREQTFDPRPKYALVPVFFASGTRDTFSPGWSHQPGLKVSLVPGTKNSGTRAHFDRGSKVCSLLVEYKIIVISIIIYRIL